MRQRRSVRRLLLIELVALALIGCAPTEELIVSDARLIQPVSGAGTVVAYFVIRNSTDASMALTGATSPMASSIEMHTHVREGDMLRMRKLERVLIAPGETLAFAPGGNHLMVFGLDPAVRGPVEIRLEFSDHEPRAVAFEVRQRNGDER